MEAKNQKESYQTTLMFCDSIKMGSYLSDALSFVIVKKDDFYVTIRIA